MHAQFKLDRSHSERALTTLPFSPRRQHGLLIAVFFSAALAACSSATCPTGRVGGTGACIQSATQGSTSNADTMAGDPDAQRDDDAGR
jgi:hypothetical protein